jgi:hypothetical protein
MVKVRFIFLINGVLKTLLPDWKAPNYEMATEVANTWLILLPDCVAAEIVDCS